MGGGRKAKSITSLLEQSQKGKDMSQWTECSSLSLSLAPLGWQPSPLCLSPEYLSQSWDCGDWDSKSSMCVQTAGFVG